MNRIEAALRAATPAVVLKWASVLFVIALQILVVVALVLSMVGAFK